MRRSRNFGAVALALSLFMIVSSAKAAVFPDVPDGHLFQRAIEHLAEIKVIGGNPDGTFKPEKPVNRAELLAMLYRSTAKTPDAKRGCFPDVQPGSWYELYVCDAAAKGYVKGYEDGYFRPNNPVNRVEALKMITLVFGLQVPEVTGDTSFVTQGDVDFGQWYGKYLLHAWNMSILPVPGMDARTFGPAAPLSRGEAAAYIENAMSAHPRAATSSASSAGESVSVQSSSAEGRSSRASQSSEETAVIKTLSIPSALSGNFKKKLPIAYRFTLPSSLMLSVDVLLTGAAEGDVTCRLYKIESEGFSNEYYLGFQEQGKCQLRAKLGAGDYQLETQPTVAEATFTVDVKTAKGDGNDGFSEAKPFIKDSPRSDSLEVGDLADWYKFSLVEQKQMTVETTGVGEYECVIYPMADVDIYGFAGPKCNESYLFPKGTYYVGISRKKNHPERATYTVRVK